MQTFLPFPSLALTMGVLDRARLGKQRVECYQIAATLLPIPTLAGEVRSGWSNHPAVRMWRGSEVALARYGLAACVEWRARGYSDNLADAFRLILDAAGEPTDLDESREELRERASTSSLISVLRTLRWASERDQFEPDRGSPAWWGRPDVHASHRAVLRAKDPDWYSARLPPEPAREAEYVWPI